MTAAPRYGSPEAMADALNRAAKEQAVVEAAQRDLEGADARNYRDRRVNQLRRDAVFHSALRRLGGSTQGRWVVKGGVALQLRLDPSRPSLDIDVAWIGDRLDHAVALEDLRRVLQEPGDDFFQFMVDLPGAREDSTGALEVPIDAMLGGRRFDRFTIDIGPVRESIAADPPIDVPPPLGIAQLGTAIVVILSVTQQLADKVCAIHEMRGDIPSTRWRDLADVAMIAQQVAGIDATELARRIETEAAIRSSALPSGLPSRMLLLEEQLTQWSRSWGTGGREVPIGMDDALEITTRFLDPVLAGTARGEWQLGVLGWSG
ncbi:MAG: hypothetical protein JWM90_3003 [Thermoleophilia bacterium]|nr:hypothetical protein [Thermoleophilia bacterium]